MSPSLAGSRLDADGAVATLLARHSEQHLLDMAREGDLRAREEIIRRFLPVTRRIAARYRHRGLSREDLEQVASVGLIKAVDRYDPDVGPFAGYAMPTIVGELKRYFRDRGWAMRIPRFLQERLLQINHAVDDLSAELGRSPTPMEIARRMGLDLEQVAEALEASSAYSPAALDAPRPGDDDGERTLADSLGAEDPRYELVDLGQVLSPTLRALPARERKILRLRFVEDLTQSEIAERIGISQMHVSRLLRRALEKLSSTAEAAAIVDCERDTRAPI